MTCLFFGGRTPNEPRGVICVNEQHRLHVGKRYIWMSWHNYTGPSFYTMEKGKEVEYEPENETDPVWGAFGKWYDKRTRSEACLTKA